VNARRVVRRALPAVATLLLLAVAWGALSGGVGQFQRSHTAGQRIETVVQLACGLLSLLMIATAFPRRRRARAIRVAWVISLAATAGVSGLVWGPPSVAAAIGLTAATMLLAIATLWLLRAGSRETPD
jgi:peptidoglycan/LPS O-acetylase OafA/YrhL